MLVYLMVTWYMYLRQYLCYILCSVLHNFHILVCCTSKNLANLVATTGEKQGTPNTESVFRPNVNWPKDVIYNMSTVTNHTASLYWLHCEQGDQMSLWKSLPKCSPKPFLSKKYIPFPWKKVGKKLSFMLKIS
jgi:hypothetical protein